MVLEDKEITEMEIINENYSAILPNYGDWSFIKIIFDQTSLLFFRKNFCKLKDPLTKLLVLRALYDMVKDAKTRGTDLIETLIENNVIEESLGNAVMLQAVVDFIMGSITFIPKHYTEEIENIVFQEILRAILLTKNEKDINILKPKLISVANSVSNIEKLK